MLDISDDPKERSYAFPLAADVNVRRIVCRPDVWPNLVSLDVSGRPLETVDILKSPGIVLIFCVWPNLYFLNVSRRPHEAVDIFKSQGKA